MDTFSRTDATKHFLEYSNHELRLTNEIQELMDKLNYVKKEREKFETIVIDYIKKEKNN